MVPKAEEDNPDPSKLAPAAVIGWENLKERLVEQQKEMQKMASFVAVSYRSEILSSFTPTAAI